MAKIKSKEYTASELLSTKALGYEGYQCENQKNLPGTGFQLMCKEGWAPNVKTLSTAWDYSRDTKDLSNGKLEISVKFGYTGTSTKTSPIGLAIICTDFTAKNALCTQDPSKKVGWSLSGCQSVGAKSSTTCETTSYKLGFVKCACKPGFKPIEDNSKAGKTACTNLKTCLNYDNLRGFKCARIKECKDPPDPAWQGNACSKADLSKSLAENPACNHDYPTYEFKVGHACQCPKNTFGVSHYALQLLDASNKAAQVKPNLNADIKTCRTDDAKHPKCAEYVCKLYDWCGENLCSDNSACANTPTSELRGKQGYACECKPGFLGDAHKRDKTGCANVNECIATGNYPCGENTVCTDSPGSYSCTCLRGFKKIGSNRGDDCENVNEADDAANSRFRAEHLAAAKTCGVDASVRDLKGSYYCLCNDGYEKVGDGNKTKTQTSCTDVNECASDKLNTCGASNVSTTCRNVAGAENKYYACDCKEHFSRATSASNKDKCTRNNRCLECAPGGMSTCTHDSSTQWEPRCACKPGTLGDGYVRSKCVNLEP